MSDKTTITFKKHVFENQFDWTREFLYRVGVSVATALSVAIEEGNNEIIIIVEE